jgi:spectinomycin phosphotransferase
VVRHRPTYLTDIPGPVRPDARQWRTVRSPFHAVPEQEIQNLIATRWGIGAPQLREVLDGAGAYHWEFSTADGERWFVTCDDLATKPWLGDDPDTVFDHLLSAYRTATELRSRGLPFVVAPAPSLAGAPAERLDERHSLAIFEHVSGEAGQWGQSLSADVRHEVVRMLAGLHRVTVTRPAVVEPAPRVSDRHALEAALAVVDQPWVAGPLSDAARGTLLSSLDVITAWLTEMSRLATAQPRQHLVVTHGEPHPGNLIRTAGGLRLVDWDTVALAPPERDVWMIADPATVDQYRELTGTRLDPELLSAYRLLWAINDVAAFTIQLRGPHRGSVDDQRALRGLNELLRGDEPRPYGPVPRLL